MTIKWNNFEEKLENNYKLALFLLFVGLIFFRAPILLLEPRLWAEEASLYMVHSMHSDWIDGIFFSPKYTAGYFALSCSLPATIAAHSPLRLAPFITTYFSLLVFLLLIVKVIWNDSDLFKPNINKLVICCIILFFPPGSAGEVWLNATNLQVYCACISLIILLSESENKTRIRLPINVGLLIFCGLSGPYSIFLGPAFFYRLLKKRNLEALIYSLAIGLTGLIQVSLYFYLKHEHFLSAKKTGAISFAKTFVGMFRFHIVEPILGMEFGGMLLNAIGFSTIYHDNIVDNHLQIAGILSAIIIAILFSLTWKKNYQHKLLMICFLSVSMLTAIFATHNVPHNRYTFFPSVILGLILMSSSWKFEWKPKIVLSSLLLFCGLFFGLLEFRSFRDTEYFGKSTPRPEWSKQIKAWEKDPMKKLTIWPYPRWKFNLPKKSEIGKMRKSIDSIEAFTISSKPNGWSGERRELNGEVNKIVLKLKMSTENISPEDIVQLRIIDNDNPTSFYSGSIIKNWDNDDQTTIIIDVDHLHKVGNPRLSNAGFLEIRLKSMETDVKLNVHKIKYVNSRAAW